MWTQIQNRITNKMIGELVCFAVLCDFVQAVSTCSYVVESRRVTERSTGPDELYFPNPCDITMELKDRWTIDGGKNKERLRIRGSTVLVKYRTTRLKYKCLEKRGLTYLFGTTGYLGTSRSVLCLSFAHIMDHPVAEYRITRLNKHGPENHLLSPDPLPEEMTSFPGLNQTCYIPHKESYSYALIRRTEKRCTFPDELQKTWNYTFHNAKNVVFSKKTLVLNLFKGGVFRFDCSIRDGDLYVLRSPEFTMTEWDGVMCFNITKLEEEPFYMYEMSRLNSGKHLEGHVKLIPAGTTTSFEKDCDWLDSPARPEYLY